MSGFKLLNILSSFFFRRSKFFLNEKHFTRGMVFNNDYFTKSWIICFSYELVILFLRPSSIVFFFRIIWKRSWFFSGCLCHIYYFIYYFKIQISIFKILLIINLLFQYHLHLNQMHVLLSLLVRNVISYVLFHPLMSLHLKDILYTLLVIPILIFHFLHQIFCTLHRLHLH